MKRMFFVVLVLAAWSVSNGAQTAVTVFEGARVIIGDGRAPIENATIVVDGARITQVGRAADVKAPAGAARVSLAGKTVIPTLIDTHVHLSQDRDALTQDLRRRAYYGVSAAMSLGQDTGDAPFQIRAQPTPRRGALLHRRPRLHRAGTGAHDRTVLGHHRGRGPKGSAGARRQEGRHRQDLGGRSQRPVQEADAGPLRRRHRRGA